MATLRAHQENTFRKRLRCFESGAAQWLLAFMLISPMPSHANSIIAPELTETETTELIMRSLGLLGVEYRWGGSTPAGGLDCSGFVRHVYQEALGLTLPRRAEEMAAVGEAVDRAQLRAGDLVFFNTLSRPYSHVGLYLGADRFVHAPSTGNVIRIEPLSARYWTQRFEGGRRIGLQSALMAQDRSELDRLIALRTEDPTAVAPNFAARAARTPSSARGEALHASAKAGVNASKNPRQAALLTQLAAPEKHAGFFVRSMQQQSNYHSNF